MIIRQARPEDAPAIADIWNRMIRETTRTFTPDEKQPEAIGKDIEARGPAFLVAERDGRVQGFATYFDFRSGAGYARTKEHTVILADEAIGQGIGKALMQRLEDIARNDGVHSLIAGISGENSEAIAFHQAVGFNEVARIPEVGHKFGRYLDLVLMQKFL